MSDREILERAKEIAARAGARRIHRDHVRRAEKELGQTLKVGK